MRSDLTDITIVVDRSGSMSSIKGDAEGGVNSFIEEQQRADGDATLTLVEFDDQYEFFCKGVPIGEAKKYELHPRGCTALLDAVGRAITEAGERLKAIPEADRPGLVAFVIVTDGGENASREFGLEKVKEMIEHQTEKYGWQFTYLGANQDAFAVGGGMGIASSANFSPQAVGMAYASAAANVTRMRSATLQGQTVTNAYTDDELKAMS